MKYVLSLLALAVGLCAVPVMAENGNVPHDTLAAMGLSDLAPISDAQGETVKGKFALAGSFSASAVPGAANFSPAFATGNNVAFAKSGAQSAGFYGGFGCGLFGPFPFGFGGGGFGGGAAVRTGGFGFAFGF
jgi:hypothetical protein